MRKAGLVIKELFNGTETQQLEILTSSVIDNPLVVKYPSRYSWFLGDKKLTVKEATIYALLHKG